MRRTLIFSAVVALIFAAQAASAATPQKSVCKPGTIVKNSSARITDAATFASAVGTFTGSSNLCTNEKISLSIHMTGLLDGYGSLTDEVTCICTKASDLQTVGCGKGQTQPTVTFDLSARNSSCNAATFTISKCVSSPVAAFTAACGGADMAYVEPSGATVSVDLSAKAIGGMNDTLQAALGGDQSASAAVIQAFGLSPERAKAAVANNPDQVNAMLQCLSASGSCDSGTLVQSAQTIGLKLDPQFAQRALEDPQQFINAGGAAPAQGSASVTSESGGGNTTLTGEGTTIPDALGTIRGLCDQPMMGGCGGVCGSWNNSLTCRTNNPGALVCGSIASQYGAIGCDPNNNTAVFPTVEAGIAAQARLLTSSARYFGSGTNSILGAFCNGYSTSNCSEYAAFISAQTGIPINQTIDPNNAAQIAAIMMASSRFENGRGVIYTADQLQTGLLAGYGLGSLPQGTPGYVPGLAQGIAAGPGFTSPLNVWGGSSPALVGSYGSPLMTAVPVGYTAPPSYQSAPPAPPQTIPLQTAPTLQGSAALNIVLQPTSTAPGSQVLVSWTSLGTNGAPCSVLLGTTTVAQGSSGTTRIAAPNVRGAYAFTLVCQSSAGSAQVSAPLLVK